MGQPLRNLTVLPLLLSPERDEALWQLTEGRISVFSHDMVPGTLCLQIKNISGIKYCFSVFRLFTHKARTNC